MLQDHNLMPFGKYKGTKMENVPASYLLWLNSQENCQADVKEYIQENMNVLLHEVKTTKS